MPSSQASGQASKSFRTACMQAASHTHQLFNYQQALTCILAMLMQTFSLLCTSSFSWRCFTCIADFEGTFNRRVTPQYSASAFALAAGLCGKCTRARPEAGCRAGCQAARRLGNTAGASCLKSLKLPNYLLSNVCITCDAVLKIDSF